MNNNSPTTELFKQQLQNLLANETKNHRTIKLAKNENVYTCGDKSDSVYFIIKGKIKLMTLSQTGKECFLAIYTSGDIFGELCLSELSKRQETAITMEETVIKKLPCSKFFDLISDKTLLEGFVRYLAMRIAEQQELITNLTTIDCEQRLGKTLLRLANKIGKKDPRSVRINHKISHEDLSKMVGTTRPRISQFMRIFRELNLIEISKDHFIIVKENNLTNYLDQAI